MRKGKREKENQLRTRKRGGKSKVPRLSPPKGTRKIQRSIGQNTDTIQIKEELDSESNVFPTAQVHDEAQIYLSEQGIKLGTVVISPSTFLEYLSRMDESLVTNGFMLDLFNFMKAAKPFTWKEMKKALSLCIPSISDVSNSAFYSSCLAIKDKKLAMIKNCDKIKMSDFLTKKYNPPSARSKRKHSEGKGPSSSSTEVTSSCLSNSFMNEVTVNVNKDFFLELERKKQEHALLLEDNLELKAKCDQLKAKNKELRSLVMVAGEPMIYAQTIKRKEASISLWRTRFLTLKAKKSGKKIKVESLGSSKQAKQHGEGIGVVEGQESVQETNI